MKSSIRSFLVGGCVALRFATVGLAEDWPQFLGPTRNGVYSGKDVSTSWPKEGPPVLWTKKIGAGWSAPVVANGKLILFHRLDDKEVLECLDALTGRLIWSGEYPTAYVDDFRFDEGPRGTPAIAGGKIYTLGAEGVLKCWNLADGKVAWTVDTREKFGTRKGFFGVACSPLVESNLVLVNIGGKDGAGIVAFETATGKMRWKATDEEASYSSPVVAPIKGRRYAFFYNRNGLVALDPVDGKVTFEYEWRPAISASVNAATPLIIDDLIFLSTSYGRGATLLRFKEAGPEQVWAEDDVLSNHYSTSVYRDGFLYGFDGRQDQSPYQRLRCVEMKTGKVRWTETGLGAGTVTLADGNLIVLTESGQLLCAPAVPDGFKPSAKAQVLPFGVRAYLALANGCLYARSKSQLTCVDLRKKP